MTSWDASPYSVGANTGLWQSAAFKDHLDYWRPATDTNFGPNPNAFYPRPLFGAGSKNFQTSDRYLQNAAYMKNQEYSDWLHAANVYCKQDRS